MGVTIDVMVVVAYESTGVGCTDFKRRTRRWIWGTQARQCV